MQTWMCPKQPACSMACATCMATHHGSASLTPGAVFQWGLWPVPDLHVLLQEATECHTFVMWFDAIFTQRFGARQEVVLSTSPHEPQTHWHQAVVLLRSAPC